MGARVAVVGGGLGGLAAAALLARAGAQVTVFEAATRPGGRAATQNRGGYRWNWGGHALYRTGPAAAVLRHLGVEPHGCVVRGAGYMRALHEGALVKGPFSPWTVSTPLLSTADRVELARLLAGLPSALRGPLGTTPLGAWLDGEVRRPRVRQMLLALVRLSSFAHDPSRQAADAALRQVVLALGGVWYLHGGWQQLVDGLRRAAEAAGVVIRTQERVALIHHDDAVRRLTLANGDNLAVDAALLAVGSPRQAAELLDGPAAAVVSGWATSATPVRAATWELSLRRVPAGAVWVLGWDVPLYMNVHSHFAQVAPPSAGVVHVVRYLGSEEPSPRHRVEMQETLDLALPGWRTQLVEDRCLPALAVAHDLPTAERGGLRGRPGPLVAGTAGLAVVGDWVGPRGHLGDAVLASAQDAARLLTAGVSAHSEVETPA